MPSRQFKLLSGKNGNMELIHPARMTTTWGHKYYFVLAAHHSYPIAYFKEKFIISKTYLAV